MLPIHFFTIVRDGMPYIPCHLPMMNRLTCDWQWHVIEGGVTQISHGEECKIPPGLSTDGTHEYLREIASNHPRVFHHFKPVWRWKEDMCNYSLGAIKGDCLLWEIDVDEIWEARQIETMRQMFIENPERNCAHFWCRYFIGPNIITTVRDAYGNNSGYEWKRVWRVVGPGVSFQSHQPPGIAGMNENPFTHAETEAAGLVFDHYAWATEAHVRFKQRYYRRHGVVSRWHQLQNNQQWPNRLDKYMPHIGDTKAWVGPLYATTRN